MKECSKSIARRLCDANFANRYFVGDGLDLGGKPDPLALYRDLFSRMTSARTWDREDGDAQQLSGVPDAAFDFVHSSHCLEHLIDPYEGIRNWFRVLRPGGHMVVTVPDEDMYEQGIFPSTFNTDHKWTFTIWKRRSWSNRSVNLVDLVQALGEQAELIRLEQLSSTYQFNLPRVDQSLGPVAECGIEMVVRKRPATEVESGGRWTRSSEQPEPEMRIHLNQYRDDIETLKRANHAAPPFKNDAPLK